MKSENNPSGHVSATTSRTAPPKAPQGTAGAADKKDDKKKKKGAQPTEADFITRQQEQARAAMSAVVADMKRAVAEGGNVREWTRQYPWIMAGSAAVAGFAAALLATPGKEESFRDKWEAIKDRLTPDAEAEATAKAAEAGARSAVKGEQPGVLGTVVREAMKAVGPMLGGLITSAMASRNPQPEDGDGHPGNGSDGPADEASGAPQD